MNNKTATPQGTGTQDTLLREATNAEDAEIVKLLLAYGTKIHTKDKHGITPLHHAVRAGELTEFLKVVEFLLANGADIEAKDTYGNTLLNSAADYSSSSRVISFLGKKKADIHSENKAGFTPLRKAVMLGHTEVVKTLLQYGAHTEINDSLLMCAKKSGKQEIVDLLSEHMDAHNLENSAPPLRP